MSTETLNIRVFLAPINEPVNGDWYTLGVADPEKKLRASMNEVRADTGAEELRISDAEGLPRDLIPKYGGVPVEKIVAFVDLAHRQSLDKARAYLEVLNRTGEDVGPPEWYASFNRTYGGVQDSIHEWAVERIRSGAYPKLAEVAEEMGLSYINVDRVRRNLEHDWTSEFVRTNEGVHLFHADDLAR